MGSLKKIRELRLEIFFSLLVPPVLGQRPPIHFLSLTHIQERSISQWVCSPVFILWQPGWSKPILRLLSMCVCVHFPLCFPIPVFLDENRLFCVQEEHLPGISGSLLFWRCNGSMAVYCQANKQCPDWHNGQKAACGCEGPSVATCNAIWCWEAQSSDMHRLPVSKELDPLWC